MKKIIFTLFIASIAVSCNDYIEQYNQNGYKEPEKEPDTPPDPEVPSDNPLTFEATTNKWSDTDRLAVYSFTQEGIVATQSIYGEVIGIESGIGSSNGIFMSTKDVAVWKGNATDNITFASYYPEMIALPQVTDGKVQVSLAATQNGEGTGIYWGKKTMSVEALESDSKVFLSFSPATSTMKLQMRLADSYPEESISITSFNVSATDKNLAGQVSLDLSTGEMQYGSKTSSEITVTLNSPLTITKNTTQTIEIGLFPVSSTNLSIRGTTVSGESVVMKSISVSDNQLTAGNSFQYETEILDKVVLANCYIINAKKLPATFSLGLQQAVDGSNTIKALQGQGSGVETILSSGEWEITTIWKTWPGADNVTGIRKEGTNDIAVLSFPSSTSNGNSVLIGLKGTSDGKIYWSWHLWFTDYNPVSDTEAEMNGQVHTYFGNAFLANGAHEGKVIMDRNLGAPITGVNGAISQPKSNEEAAKYFGFHYQFGRKDPFPASADGTTPNRVKLYDATGNELRWEPQGSANTTLLQSIQNPTTFFFNAGKNWIGQEDIRDLWDMSGTSKSVFDPCPAGWRMPLGDGDDKDASLYPNPAARNIWSGWGKNSPGSIGSGTEPKFVKWSASIEGHTGTAGAKYQYEDGIQAWYPAQGLIEQADGTFKNVGKGLVNWSASFVAGNNTQGRRLNISANKVEPSSASVRGGGMPVRCIKF